MKIISCGPIRHQLKHLYSIILNDWIIQHYGLLLFLKGSTINLTWLDSVTGVLASNIHSAGSVFSLYQHARDISAGSTAKYLLYLIQGFSQAVNMHLFTPI